MKTARRYLAREIYRSTIGVLLVLIGLFVFFDMVENLDNLNKQFTFLNLLGMQVVGLPSHIYDLLPVALLIGTIISMASLVQRNEIAVLRVSGVSSRRFVMNLWLIAVPIMIFSFALSEFLTPYAEASLARVNMKYLSKTSEGTLGSGYWFRENTSDGDLRVLNILKINSDNSISGLNMFNIDQKTGDVTRITYAGKATFQADQQAAGKYQLKLEDVSEKKQTRNLHDFLTAHESPGTQLYEVVPNKEILLDTTLTPSRIKAGILTPERMSTSELMDYIRYQQENHTSSSRYEVAIWRKLSYPFTLLVMITLAAPLAFMQVRKGGVSIKVFLGILIGITFFVVNQLILNVGMLAGMPAWLTATLPSVIAMVLAFVTLIAIENKTRPPRRLRHGQ